MSKTKTKDILLFLDHEIHVDCSGDLYAVRGDRHYPIDGLHEGSQLFYQKTNHGIVTYFTPLCENAEAAGADAGTAGGSHEPNTEDLTVELDADMITDAELAISNKEMSGCIAVLVFVLGLIILGTYSLAKYLLG